MTGRDDETLESTPNHAGDPFATFESHEPVQPVRADLVKFDRLVRGDQIGDFRIQGLLGRGSFGAVYLARELSLDRLIALKVVLPEGQRTDSAEGRSLARLKHPNIIGVYGEAVDPRSGCQLLWMQYADGCDLATLIASLWKAFPDGDWNQEDFNRASTTDEHQEHPIHADAIPGRIETVCRIGTQLAEALAHAHTRGIVHRDIKPANILMSRDGTPLLADFNLADQHDELGSDRVGGTLAYMPPEQIALVLGRTRSIDTPRADIYALGMVLWELAHGKRPHAEQEDQLTSQGRQRMIDLMDVRQQEITSDSPGAMIGLNMILRRAMAVEPCKRFPSANGLATALRGLEQLQHARRESPVSGQLFAVFRRHFFWVILIAGLIPHFAASGLQISYNKIWIKPDGDAFVYALIAYNIVIYPACVGWLAWNLFRFAADYRRVVARQEIPRSRLRQLRDRLLKFPRQFTIAASFGWFPGVILFPWLLGMFGPMPSTEDRIHYAISFSIAGAIAATYSYALVAYLVCVHGYRACWQTGTLYRDRARYELRGMERRVGRVSILAGTLPLAAAILLLAEPEDRLSMESIDGLHYLAIALIVAGGIGMYLMIAGAARLVRVIRALTLSQE